MKRALPVAAVAWVVAVARVVAVVAVVVAALTLGSCSGAGNQVTPNHSAANDSQPPRADPSYRPTTSRPVVTTSPADSAEARLRRRVEALLALAATPNASPRDEFPYLTDQCILTISALANRQGRSLTDPASSTGRTGALRSIAIKGDTARVTVHFSDGTTQHETWRLEHGTWRLNCSVSGP